MNFVNVAHLLRPAAALSLLAAAACGSLSSQTGSASTLATLHGTIVQAQSASSPPSDLATALVWLRPGPGGTSHLVAVSTQVTATFPASFSIDVTEPPPEAMMFDYGEVLVGGAPIGVSVAEGVLLAYDDRNHNGQLDLAEPGSTGYVDAIIGWEPSDTIYYFAGPVPASVSVADGTHTIPGDDGSRPQPGYNFQDARPNVCVAAADGGVTCTVNVATWKPIDTPITLTIGGYNEWETGVMDLYMCGENAKYTETSAPFCSSPSCVESPSTFGALPSADDPALECSPDSRTFNYPQCTVTQSVCALSASCNNLTVSLDPPGAPALVAPADWPCRAQSSL